MTEHDEPRVCPASLRAVVASGDRDTLARIQQSFGGDSCVQLVGVAGDGIEAAQLTVINQPDVVILDDRLDGDGLRVCAVLNEVAPRTKIVLLVQGLNEKAVMDAARAGAREVMDYSFEPAKFLEAVGRITDAEKELLTRQYEWATNPQSFPRLLVISSAKGGTGVTSVALNVATALSLTKTGRTVLLDADPHSRDAVTMLGVTARYGLADVAAHFHESDWVYQDEVLLQQVSTTPAGLDLVVSAGSRLDTPPLPVPWIGRAALQLKRTYRYVVVDAPHSIISEMEQALPTYWRLILVGNLQDATLLRNTRALLDTLASVQNRNQTVGYLLNRDRRPTEFTPKDVQEVLGVSVVATIPEDQNLVRACNLGKAVVVDNPGSPSARAILQLSQSLAATASQANTGGRFFAG